MTSRPRFGAASGAVATGGSGDDRGRVPFALVGVVLLLGSVTYANTLALRGPTAVDTAADDALERAEAAGRPAVRAAATAAARDAAENPVTAPANTTVGDALDPNAPFRDALRLRIALAAADALARTEADVGGVTATASLPAVGSPADVPAAIDRVTVEPLSDGAAMRVAVRNVTLTAREGGTVVATRRVNYSVAVAVPVLAMHERTRAYERRLNRSPFEGRGLGRSLTWRLWAVAQARGTAQYLGAPVTNVLANRHVELSTNAAALRTQGAVYGRSDPAGRAAMVRATARVGATDLLTPAMDRGPAWTRRVLGEAGTAGGGDTGSTLPAGVDGSVTNDGGDGPIRVGVNATADRAFLRLLDGEADGGFEAAVRGAYRTTASRRVAVVSATPTSPPPRDPPDGNWTFLSATSARETVVVARESVATPSSRAVADERRTVEVRHRETRYWLTNGTVRTTTAAWVDRYRVRITLDVTYAPIVGPDRPADPVFVRGGAVDGPNLADVPAAVRDERLQAGTTDRLARRAVEGGGSTTRTTQYGARPERLDEWIYRDLAGLRDRIRNVSVGVSRDSLASGEANAPARLAATIREERARLVNAPDRYDGAADRARVAARAAYVDAVLAELDARAVRAGGRNDAYADRVGDLRAGVDGRLDDLSRVAADATAPDPSPVGRWHAGEVTLTPRGTPGYLPVTAVDATRVRSPERGESIRPLVARNTNLFTVPSGDAADTVTDAALPGRRTASLATAGRTLVAAERTAAATGGSGDADGTARETLERRVASELRSVESRAATVLARRTALSARERAAAVRRANARWPTPGARAVAVVDGSYAAAVAREAAVAGSLDPIDRDRLAVRLRVAVAEAATDASVAVPADLQVGVVDKTREARREALRRAAAAAGENATETLRKRYGKRAFGGVTAGLPVAPVPGYWYATVNVWDVEVAGAYPRFVVSARVGGPDGADGRIRYVRDGANVTVDVDDDGVDERVGRNERVSFRTWTVVIVVVPAGKSGVGDVGGDADERSDGWPCPPAASAPGCPPPPPE
ncbi:DUF7286 family protein [Halobaculum sp. EA56]|uniref:DUF7286 family protein n=1 Tax=Halobaculum sp. EA56 TaxID=3421648 RepID=UPI003EBF5EBA